MLDSFFEEDEKDIEKTAFFEIEKSCMLKNVSQISGLKSSIQLISDNELMDRDFLFVLKRLLPAKNSFYSLRILIPDTVVFLNGEAKFLIYNGNVSNFFS